MSLGSCFFSPRMLSARGDPSTHIHELLMNLKLQDPLLAWVPSKALGGALNNYSFTCLILYSWLYILFRKNYPKNCKRFRRHKTGSDPDSDR